MLAVKKVYVRCFDLQLKIKWLTSKPNNRFHLHTREKKASYARFVAQAFVTIATQVVLRHVVVARQTIAWYKQIQGKHMQRVYKN